MAGCCPDGLGCSALAGTPGVGSGWGLVLDAGTGRVGGLDGVSLGLAVGFGIGSGNPIEVGFADGKRPLWPGLSVSSERGPTLGLSIITGLKMDASLLCGLSAFLFCGAILLTGKVPVSVEAEDGVSCWCSMPCG